MDAYKRRKEFDVFYDKYSIRPSEEWPKVIDKGLLASSLILIIGENGTFNSLVSEDSSQDIFLEEVKTAIDLDQNNIAKLLYLCVDDYLLWSDENIQDHLTKDAQTICGYLKKRQKINLHSTDNAFEIEKALKCLTDQIRLRFVEYARQVGEVFREHNKREMSFQNNIQL